MLNRAARISNRPYVKLLFELDVKPLTDREGARIALRNKLQSYGSTFTLVELESTWKVGALTLGYGKAYINAEIRFVGSADGRTFDSALKPLDCVLSAVGVGCELRLKDAELITQQQVASNTGGASSATAAGSAQAPLSGIGSGIVNAVEGANTTARYFAVAVIVVGVAYLATQGKPLLRNIGRAIKRRGR